MTIRTATGLTAIPWESRDALLERMRGDKATQELRSPFIAAGATRPPRRQLVQLLKVLDNWLIDAGEDQAPEGILRLWPTLAAQLGDIDDPATDLTCSPAVLTVQAASLCCPC